LTGSAVAGSVVSALSFGYLHGGFTRGHFLSCLAISVAALFLSWVVAWRRSLIPAMFLHLLWTGGYIILAPP
jgi:membrane protease YdiL (CAAX protease family)